MVLSYLALPYFEGARKVRLLSPPPFPFFIVLILEVIVSVTHEERVDTWVDSTEHILKCTLRVDLYLSLLVVLKEVP